MYRILNYIIGTFLGLIYWQASEVCDYKYSFDYTIKSIHDEHELDLLKGKFDRQIALLKHESKRITKAIAFSIIATLYVYWTTGLLYSGCCAALIILSPYILMQFQPKYTGNDVYPINLISSKAIKRKLYADTVWSITIALFIFFMIGGLIKYGTEPGSTYF